MRSTARVLQVSRWRGRPAPRSAACRQPPCRRSGGSRAMCCPVPPRGGRSGGRSPGSTHSRGGVGWRDGRPRDRHQADLVGVRLVAVDAVRLHRVRQLRPAVDAADAHLREVEVEVGLGRASAGRSSSAACSMSRRLTWRARHAEQRQALRREGRCPARWSARPIARRPCCRSPAAARTRPTRRSRSTCRRRPVRTRGRRRSRRPRPYHERCSRPGLATSSSPNRGIIATGAGPGPVVHARPRPSPVPLIS